MRIICVVFCRSLFVLFLLTMSAFLRCMTSDYPFGVFKLPPFRHLTTYASPDTNSNPESSLESLTKDSYLLYSDSKVRSLLDSFRHHYSLEKTSSCQSVVIFLLSLKQFFTSKFRSYISQVSFAHKRELKYRSYY